jgi:hypothetical protein
MPYPGAGRATARHPEGNAIIVSRAGRPVATLGSLDSPLPQGKQRIGILTGAFSVPVDLDRMGAVAIEALLLDRTIGQFEAATRGGSVGEHARQLPHPL